MRFPPVVYPATKITLLTYSATVTCNFWIRNFTTRKCDVVIRSVASVCLSCSGSEFWKHLPRNFIFGTQVHPQNTKVKFVYQGHQVKVKVTGTKSVSVGPVRGWTGFDWQAILFYNKIRCPHSTTVTVNHVSAYSEDGDLWLQPYIK